MITDKKCDILKFLSSLLSLNLFIIGINIKFEIANKMQVLAINKKSIDKFCLKKNNTLATKLKIRFRR